MLGRQHSEGLAYKDPVPVAADGTCPFPQEPAGDMRMGVAASCWGRLEDRAGEDAASMSAVDYVV